MGIIRQMRTNVYRSAARFILFPLCFPLLLCVAGRRPWRKLLVPLPPQAR